MLQSTYCFNRTHFPELTFLKASGTLHCSTVFSHGRDGESITSSPLSSRTSQVSFPTDLCPDSSWFWTPTHELSQ